MMTRVTRVVFDQHAQICGVCTGLCGQWVHGHVLSGSVVEARGLFYCTCIEVQTGAFNTTTGPAHWELLQRGRALGTLAGC